MPVILGSTCAVLPSDIYGAKIPFPLYTVNTWQEIGILYLCPCFIPSPQSVGRIQSAVHSPCFIPETVFYTQSVMLGPRFIPQSMFYTQSAVRSPQSLFYTGRARNNILLLAANVLGDARRGQHAKATRRQT